MPANWPVVPKPDDERPVEVAKTQAGAAANRVFIAIADRCGPERGVDWFGSSVICDLHGFLVAGPAVGDPVILLADLDLGQADDKRLGPHNDALSDLRLDLASVPERKLDQGAEVTAGLEGGLGPFVVLDVAGFELEGELAGVADLGESCGGVGEVDLAVADAVVDVAGFGVTEVDVADPVFEVVDELRGVSSRRRRCG